jgi:hypothetical protein
MSVVRCLIIYSILKRTEPGSWVVSARTLCLWGLEFETPIDSLSSLVSFCDFTQYPTLTIWRWRFPSADFPVHSQHDRYVPLHMRHCSKLSVATQFTVVWYRWWMNWKGSGRKDRDLIEVLSWNLSRENDGKQLQTSMRIAGASGGIWTKLLPSTNVQHYCYASPFVQCCYCCGNCHQLMLRTKYSSYSRFCVHAAVRDLLWFSDVSFILVFLISLAEVARRVTLKASCLFVYGRNWRSVT